jgi:hypothetical protein
VQVFLKRALQEELSELINYPIICFAHKASGWCRVARSVGGIQPPTLKPQAEDDRSPATRMRGVGRSVGVVMREQRMLH